MKGLVQDYMIYLNYNWKVENDPIYREKIYQNQAG